MYKDLYDQPPKLWSYPIPTTCNTDNVKLFSLNYPYNGPRLNKAILTMPDKPDHIYSKGLADLQTSIPTNFSWRSKGGDMIEKGVRDQGNCGDCWAFSVASSLGDRFALKYKIKSPYPSSAWLTTNAKPPEVASNYECITGGNVMLASQWLEKPYNGIKLEQCWPYSVIKDNDFISPTPLNKIKNDCCFNCCGDKVKDISNILFSCKPGSSKYLVVMNNDNTINTQSTINAIKLDIMINGPVTSSFYVYKDFMTYWRNDAPSGKVYIRNSYEMDGGHAVVLTGWGTQKDNNGKDIDYWEMRNSWGNTGDNGYCKIALSTSTPINMWCQIDIPLYNGQEFNGGVVSFLPSELDLNTIKILKKINTISISIPTPASNFFSKNILYIIIGIIIIFLIILMIFLAHKSTNQQYTNQQYTNQQYTNQQYTNTNINNSTF